MCGGGGGDGLDVCDGRDCNSSGAPCTLHCTVSHNGRVHLHLLCSLQPDLQRLHTLDKVVLPKGALQLFIAEGDGEGDGEVVELRLHDLECGEDGGSFQRIDLIKTFPVVEVHTVLARSAHC